MELTIVTTWGDQIKCKAFFDIVGTSTEISGIEVSNAEGKTGRIIGEDLPDETDTEEIEKFTKMVEVWLIDNGF
jgi:hypothetical protein